MSQRKHGSARENLYYWFSDKDEIVRELYARYVAAYDRVWVAGDGDADDHCDLLTCRDPPEPAVRGRLHLRADLVGDGVHGVRL